MQLAHDELPQLLFEILEIQIDVFLMFEDIVFED